jgi:fatty-acyl-CoA synthase
MTELVTDGLCYWAKQSPGRAAIVFDGTDKVDYLTLDRWTDVAAHHLLAKGLAPADRVGIIGDNSLEWVVSAIGALKTGAIVVPLNNRFTTDELRYLVEDSSPRLVLADDAHRDKISGALDTTAAKLVGLPEFTALRHAEHRPVGRREGAGPDETTQIVYTSGTSSRPKGVIFTHRSTFNLIANFAVTEPALRPGAGIIYTLSMSGAPGLLWHILQPLTRGMTIYYERGFDPGTTLRRIADEKIQVHFGVPLLYERMAAHPDFESTDLSSLELVTMAGAAAPLPTIKTWLDKGVPLRQAYGMTELGGLSTINSPEQALARPESIGWGMVFARHRVVRPDGSDCDPEEPGEIIVASPGVTPGYWRNEQAYASAVRDGWFHSGDVGLRDAEGWIRVIDRLKDIIITGGFNVAPSEVEAVVAEIPGVLEVCVIAAHDAKFGETPAAIVYADTGVTPGAVTEHCRERLAGYKVPRQVVIQQTPLPRMASGKIARREIREAHRELTRPSQPVG